MSAERDSLFRCLTQSGWQTIENEDERPAGWVRIYEEEIYQGSPFGRTSRHWRLLGTNDEIGNEAADRLEQQFPKPEPKRELSPETIERLQAKLTMSKKQTR